MATSHITIKTIYISSGRKNAMYTLRSVVAGNGFFTDNYICNLSTDKDLAETKARDYYDRIEGRVNQSESFKLVFDGFADFDLFERRGKMSVRDTEMLERVEAGFMPFGKYSGKRIEDLEEGYLMWWTDRNVNDSEYVALAIKEACLGVAMEKGYIATRQAKLDARAEQDAKSQHIGEVGQRIEFEGTLLVCKEIGATQVAWSTVVVKFLNIIQCGDNKVVYFGTPMGHRDDFVKFKATVKEHNDRNGCKQTVVWRPKMIEVSNEQSDQ